jgi:hypothetical protein
MKKTGNKKHNKEGKTKLPKNWKLNNGNIDPAPRVKPVQQDQGIIYYNTIQSSKEDNIPDRYYDNKIVLLIRDPYWCFAYWDISNELMEQKIREIRKEWGNYGLALRINEIQAGNKKQTQDDILISGGADNWYIKINDPGKSYMVEIGLKTEDGHFLLIAASNTVEMPNDHVSDIVDEEWMDGDFGEILKMSTDGRPAGGSENVFSSARFYVF